jgi:hypothetical protein
LFTQAQPQLYLNRPPTYHNAHQVTATSINITMGGFYMQYLESKSIMIRSVPFLKVNSIHAIGNCPRKHYVTDEKKKSVQGKPGFSAWSNEQPLFFLVCNRG